MNQSEFHVQLKRGNERMQVAIFIGRKKWCDLNWPISLRCDCNDVITLEAVLTCWFPSMRQLNPGQVGFYRVQYSFAMLEHLLPAIRDNSLPPRDRLGLESDLFALVCEVRAFSIHIEGGKFIAYASIILLFYFPVSRWSRTRP